MTVKEYSDLEQKYIRENAGELSWSEIAYNLNKLYPTNNEGKRTRSGVIAWHTQDKDPLIRRQVLIPKTLLEQYKELDLSKVLCDALDSRSAKKATTK